MKKRIFLLFGYWIMSFMLMWLFILDGHGSFAPFCIVASWAGFVMKLLSRVLPFAEDGLIFEGFVIDLILFCLYYAGLIRLVSRLVAGRKKRAFLIPWLIHLIGGLAVMMTSDDGRGLFPPGFLDSQGLDWEMFWFYLASYVIPWILSFLWLSVDWRLAKKPDDLGRSMSAEDGTSQ